MLGTTRTRDNENPDSQKTGKTQAIIYLMDTIDFRELFAFTAIDIFSKEMDILWHWR